MGEDSKAPNVGGIRRALVEHLKRVRPPVIRYPGGCFADSYDRRDGVEPREEAEVAARGGSPLFRFPPAPVTHLQLSI